MRRSFSLASIVLTLLVILVSFHPSFSQEAPPRSRASLAEDEILTRLNEWRLRHDLVPLVRNTDLDDLARQQAEFVFPYAPFSGEFNFHADAYGDSVIRRAQLIGWPHYDLPEQVLVSEIAAYYPDVDGAINFWQTSPPHRSAALTAGFREAGVAVLENNGWLLCYVVLGGRPDVLPVVYDPVRHVLFLSADYSFYRHDFTPRRVQILDEYGNRLHDQEWLVWSSRMPLPPNAGDYITVVVTDGIREIRTDVDLYQSRVFPSQPTPIPSATPTARPTSARALITPSPRPPTSTPLPTATPRAQGFDILLVYNGDSLTLINQSGAPLNLGPLTITSDFMNLRKDSSWLGRYAQVPLSAFPPNYCMQAWSYEITNDPPPLPITCRLLASGRSILPAGERFWLAGEFRVLYGAEQVATCRANDGMCAFDVP
jgi:uncharacterized protein YkwD